MKVFGRSNEYCIIFQTFSDFMKETNHPRSLNGCPIARIENFETIRPFR